MISVLIWAADKEPMARLRDVARSLAALVPFAVEGLVRDVGLLASGFDTTLLRLADDAGAEVFELNAATRLVKTMKSDFFLVLNAGFNLDTTVADKLAHYIYAADFKPVRIERKSGYWLKDVFFPEQAGVLLSRAQLARLSQFDPQQAASQLGRMQVLKAGASRDRR